VLNDHPGICVQAAAVVKVGQGWLNEMRIVGRVHKYKMEGRIYGADADQIKELIEKRH